MSNEFAGLMDREIRIGEFVGFRAWTMTGPSSKLRALSWEYSWDDGPNKMACLKGANYDGDVCSILHTGSPYHTNECMQINIHDRPEPSCQCGFYAYFDRRYFHSINDNRVVIYGVISAWGHVLAGNRGFRAQNARIKALALRDGDRPQIWTTSPHLERTVLGTMLTHYPEVEVFRDTEQMLEKFPLSKGKMG